MLNMTFSVDLLADRVTAWCTQPRVVPVNGQVATATNVRTLRYYRTLGVIDAPTEGGGNGFGERHFLQACAVRVLQAEGLPLTRIQSLLFGRSDVELQSILDSVATGQPATLTESAPLTQPETWQTWPITPELMLVSRQPGFQLTSGQIQAIQQILQSTRTLAVNS